MSINDYLLHFSNSDYTKIEYDSTKHFNIPFENDFGNFRQCYAILKLRSARQGSTPIDWQYVDQFAKMNSFIVDDIKDFTATGDTWFNGVVVI